MLFMPEAALVIKTSIVYIAVFSIGACIGSFANCVAYRINHNIKWYGTERSACPMCSAKIPWYDNMPLLSYILLSGKCRKCHAKIPFRYFFAEVLGGFFVSLVFFLIIQFKSC